ncbi:MAG: LTA synthase family protein [Azoarcus sp.]|nr:LTA synthase family protein [Azoarcus sp.]
MHKSSTTFIHHFILPPVAVVLLYALLRHVAAEVLGVSVQPEAIAVDLALHCAGAVALRALSRNTPVFLALLTVLMGLVHLGNAVKIAVLGGPLMPDDVSSLRSLLLLLEGGWLLLALTLGLLLAATLLAALTLRTRRARFTAGALAALGATVALAPGPLVAAMDQHFGNVSWDQHANYGWRGPLVHMVQETARHAARRSTPPDRDEVLAAADLLLPALRTAALEIDDPAPLTLQTDRQMDGRNVHMIVLESFWDPSVLEAAGLSRDPFVAEFRALWDATGRSRGLSPVFGGSTANAEFEALCGFPVSEEGVFFEGRLRNDAPCLPRALSDLGYRTVSSHPNVATFWNRLHAYRRVGFDTYWAAPDFELDDMNGPFLGDASLYRQVMDKVAPLMESGTPVFNYVLTYFGHLDYPLAANRPPVIGTDDADERIALYANTVHYKSKELMALLDELRTRDPDAIIVIFGDHLPFLGPNFEHYARSGVLAPSRGEFSDRMLVDAHATPLIVIDGRHGPLKLGDVPLYHLPSLVLELLGWPIDTPMALTRGAPGVLVRPLPGMHLVQYGDGEIAVCRGETRDPAVCAAASDWLAAVHTFGTDLFSGRQHVLREELMPSPLPSPFPAPKVIDGQQSMRSHESTAG